MSSSSSTSSPSQSSTSPHGNPFDLSKKKKAGMPAQEPKARSYTEAEKAELLHGYIELPEDLWEFAKYGTHVRYVTKAGDFRPGGFVQKNPLDSKGGGEAAPRRFIKLANNIFANAQGRVEWVAGYDTIERLYIKPDAAALAVQRMLEDAVRGLNENVKKVATYAKQLEGRLAGLEERR